MATTTTSYQRSSKVERADSFGDWNPAFVIDILPDWVYTNNKQPTSIQDCMRHISIINHVISDIDLQIQIKYQSKHSEFTQWHIKTLKAKQSQNYVLSAYKHWLTLNTPDPLDLTDKFDKLVQLLIEEPEDVMTQLKALLT